MYGRLITFMVATLLGLAAVAFFLNWMWARAFGPGVPGQQQQQQQKPMSKEEIAETRKEAREEYEARQTEKFQKEKHSEKALAAAGRSTITKLSAKEFDPSTGSLHWPKVRSQPRFHEERQLIERLSRQNAGKKELKTLTKLRSAVDELSSSLKEAIRDLPANDYIEGRHFLESLTEWIREQLEHDGAGKNTGLLPSR